jgi:hypothetical protein
MACDRFAEAIRARALGSPLRADAAAHLAVCSGCQAMLDTEKRVMATIDTALEELASAGPAPDFMSRVRAHVEGAPRWMPGAWWRPAAVGALALVMVALAMGRVLREWPVAREGSSSRPAEVVSAAPAERAAEPSLTTARPAQKPSARAPRRPVPEPARLAQTPEVLVPAQQREAVNRLFASLRAGQPEVISMLMSLHGGEPGADPRGLTIEPLRIEPVFVSAMPSSAPLLDK